MSRIGRFVSKLNPMRPIKHVAEKKAKRQLNKMKFKIEAMKLEDGGELRTIVEGKTKEKLNTVRFEVDTEKSINTTQQKTTLTVVGLETVLDIAYKLFHEDWNVTIKLDGKPVYTLEQPA